MPVLPVRRRRDLTAELVGEELHAVADAEHGEAGLEDVSGGLRSAFVVDGGWAAGEDEAARVEPLDLLPGSVVGDELAVDVALADAAGDEHRVLGTEVDNDDCFAGGGCFDGLSTSGRFGGGGLEVGGQLEVFGGGVGALGIRFEGGGGFHDGTIARSRGQGNESDKNSYQFFGLAQPRPHEGRFLPNKLQTKPL